MPKYEYIYKTNYTVSIVMCVMMLNMRMCIRRCLPAASVSIFFVFPFPIPRESQLAIQAIQAHMLLFFLAPCAAIFVNGLPNIIALFLTEHHVLLLFFRTSCRTV